MFVRQVIAAFLLIFWLAPSRASEPAEVSLTEEVAGHPGVTYLDLVSQVFPDLTTEGGTSGQVAPPLRHIVDDDYEWRAPDPAEVTRIQALPFRAEGKDGIVLLVDAGWSSWAPGKLTLLMLFDGSSTPQLVDAVDVAMDMHTSFHEPGTFHLSPDDDALAITSAHWNSNQSYVTTLMIFVREGQFALIDDIFTFSDHSCAFENRQRLRIVPMPFFAPYGQIRVSVLEEGMIIETDCGDEVAPEPYSRVTDVTYRWDDATERFLPSSDALDKLADQASERF